MLRVGIGRTRRRRQSNAIGPTPPQAPAVGNATASTTSSLTFPVTLAATGVIPSALAWRYSENGGPWVNGADIPLGSPSLGQALSETVTLPDAGSPYAVQFAAKNGSARSAWPASGTGTTNTAAGGTGAPTTVVLSPTTVNVASGAAQQLTAQTKDNTGATLTGRSYAWRVADSSVATVDGTGKVTGVAGGSTSVTATDVAANLSATVPVAVTGAPGIGPDDTVLVNSDPYFAAATQKSDLIQEQTDPNGNVFWPYGQHSDNAWGFEPNLDGNGKKAIRVDWPQWHSTSLAQDVVASSSPQTVAVVDTTGMTTGGNIIDVDPLGANKEILAQGAFTIVDGTHIQGIFTKNHSNGALIGQSWEAGTQATKPIASPTSEWAYYRLRYHVGKTAQATTGIGAVPSGPGDTTAATYYNPGDLAYSGCKRFLLERTGRVYIIFTSSGGQDVGVHLSSDGINLSRGVNTGATFSGDSYVGQDVEVVIGFAPGSSGDGSTGTGQSLDGKFKLWINGVLFMDYSNLPFGTGQVTALQFPATMRSAKLPFSEYFTGLHAWIPVPASSAPPSAPTVEVGNEVATENSLTYEIDAAATGDAPYTVIASVDENGTGAWVDQTPIRWTTGLGGRQAVAVSGLTAGKDYSGKIRFRFHNSSGDSANVPESEGTTTAPASNGSPTMSNATASTPSVLTFPGTYNGTGNPATQLRYQYSTAPDMSGAVSGPSIPVTGTLNGSFSVNVAVPNPATTYYVQFAQFDGTTQSGWSTAVSGTTTASSHTARSQVYARSTAAPIVPGATLSAVLPLASHAAKATLYKNILSGSKAPPGGSKDFTTGKATSPTSIQWGFFLTEGMDAQTIPAGNYLIELASNTDSGGSYQEAGCLAIWRPSTGAVVARIWDTATGTGTAFPFSGTGAMRVVAANLAAGVAVQAGDRLVWEPYYVGSGATATYFWYNGTDTITDGGSPSGSGVATGIVFPSAITFQA